MRKQHLKLLCVRIDEDLIQKLDEVTTKRTYWSRSEIIRNILTAVFAEMSDGDIYDMIRYHYLKKNVVNAKFEITNELKPYERK